MGRDDLERLRHLAAAGDAAAAAALAREARRRGDDTTAALATLRQEGAQTPWEVLRDRVGALRDPDPDIRALAVEEVASLDLPPQAAFDALQSTLRDPSDAVRAAACAALCGLNTPDAEAALQAALWDASPWVRDQAAASLTLRPEPDASRWHRPRWPRLRQIAAQRLGPIPAAHAHLDMDIFPVEPDRDAPPPSVDMHSAEGWALAVTDTLCLSLHWLPLDRRALLARAAPLTALAVMTEVCADIPNNDHPLWPSCNGEGPILAHPTGALPPYLLLQLDAQLTRGDASERHAAAMACSALAFHSRARALGALIAKHAHHWDATARACLLPGRLRRLPGDAPDKDTSEDRLSLLLHALQDPSPTLRALALTLLNGRWLGPWDTSGEVFNRPEPIRALMRLREWVPGRAFDHTTQDIPDADALGLYLQGSGDPERAVRAQAFVGLARVASTNPTLRPAALPTLQAAALHDPDTAARALAAWLHTWLRR